MGRTQCSKKEMKASKSSVSGNECGSPDRQRSEEGQPHRRLQEKKEMDELTSLSAVLPLTDPLPPLLSTVPASSLAVEASLARNPDHLSRWQTYLQQIAAEVDAAQRDARNAAQTTQSALLGPQLASEEARKGYQRLVETYERFVAAFPGSYKAWKCFLDARKEFVLGKPKKRVKLNAPKKKPSEDQVCLLFASCLKSCMNKPGSSVVVVVVVVQCTGRSILELVERRQTGHHWSGRCGC